MDRLHRPPRWPSAQSHHRHGRTQRHVGRRRHGSEEAALPRAHPRGGGPGRGRGAQMVESAAGARSRAPTRARSTCCARSATGREIWDVTDPAKPSRLLVLVEGLRNTHKSFWECDTGIAYVISGPKEWRTRRMTKIYDLSDPAKPSFVRDFGLPGQQPGSTVMPIPTEPRTDLLGPREIGYFGYGTSRAGSCRSSIDKSF